MSLLTDLAAPLQSKRLAASDRSRPVAVITAVTGPPMPAQRRSLPIWLARSRVHSLLTLPFIYGMALPLVLLDLGISLYQAASFPMYGIGKVHRRDYFIFDRARLPYLNAVEKVHCTYCSYANGLLSYTTEIVARTEQYWCPIKNAHPPAAAHARYRNFVDFGDGAHYETRAQALRSSLAAEGAAETIPVAAVS